VECYNSVDSRARFNANQPEHNTTGIVTNSRHTGTVCSSKSLYQYVVFISNVNTLIPKQHIISA